MDEAAIADTLLFHPSGTIEEGGDSPGGAASAGIGRLDGAVLALRAMRERMAFPDSDIG